MAWKGPFPNEKQKAVKCDVNKVDFEASDFKAVLQLQIEAKRKMLGRTVALGVKSVEKHLIKLFFNC